MKRLWGWIKIAALWVYDALDDKRFRNLLLIILIGMNAFGVVAPGTATALRDAVLSIPF